MRILALPRNVELEASTDVVFGAVLRSDTVSYELTIDEYPVFLQLCGVRRREGPISLPADVARFVNHLIEQRVAVAVPQGPDAWIVPTQLVSLAPGVELRPAVFVVVDARDQPIGLVGAIGAAIIDACDGRRVAADLSMLGGFDSASVHTELSSLQTSGLVQVLPPSMTLRRNVNVKRPADAVLAIPAQGGTKYLLTGEEAEVLGRCSSQRSVSDLLSGNDEQWTMALLSRASMLGLVTLSSPRTSARTITRTPSAGSSVVRAPVVATPAPAPAPARPPSVADMELDSPTTADGGAMVIDDLEGDAITGLESFNDMATVVAPPPIRAMQQLFTPPTATPVARVAPPISRVTAVPQVVVSTPTPFAPPTPPTRPTPPTPLAAPTPPAPLDHSAAAKLDSLSSLGLHKGASTASPERSTSKLPWILLLLAVVGGGYYHFRTTSEPSAPAQPAVETPKSDAKPSVTAGALLASGYIAAKDPIVLSTTVSGRVGDVVVANNDSIKKGQVLATIDDGQTRAELSLANARIRDAQRSLQRTKMLIKAQAATPAELDRAVGQVEIAVAEARVITQKLEDMKIRSPIDGTVLEVVARKGEALTAGPGQGVVVKVADLRALCAEIDVDQGEIKRVFMHQAAEVIADAQKGQTYKGSVYEVSQQADKARGTVLVRVDIEATPDSVLKPGMAVQVSFMPKAP